MTSSPEFRLVHPVADADSHERAVAAARDRLHARVIPKAQRDFLAAARHFQLDADLETAINTSLCVGAPLLLTGEPGTGKTQVGWYLAWYFGLPLYEFTVKSASTAENLKYDFDAVAYLRSAQHPEAETRRQRHQFLTHGPLWNAYEDPKGAVLLIDEIDKAPRDFPNDLLHELDRHAFPHPFDVDAQTGKPRQVAAARPPIVVITSNEERRLPDAFLRRCIFHHLELTEPLLRKIVAARAGDFPRLAADVVEEALARFFELRDDDRLQKKPSTAELLVWLTVLSARGTTADQLKVGPSALPSVVALIKNVEDLQAL